MTYTLHCISKLFSGEKYKIFTKTLTKHFYVSIIRDSQMLFPRVIRLLLNYTTNDQIRTI